MAAGLHGSARTTPRVRAELQASQEGTRALAARHGLNPKTAAMDGALSAAALDINLRGQAVAPMADRLAVLGVPFVFATGYGEGCDTGGHADAPVLRKPFDPHALVVAVEALASA